jgi:hypothetical protein
MERTRSHPLTIRLVGWIVSLALTASIALACPNARKSFTGILARIDAASGSAAPELYFNAASMAKSTEERLRILKRASEREISIYAGTAKAILSKGPVSQPVSVAALDALIENGMFEDALALFDGSLDPVEYPAEYAELVVRSIRGGHVPDITLERSIICAKVTGDFRWSIDAALDAMVQGDMGTAAPLLADAENQGYAIPYRLLWDARLLDVLADRIPDPVDPLELAVCADSAYLLGRKATSTYLYALIIDRFPGWSWKPYAAIAREIGEPDAAADLEWPHLPLPDSWESVSSPGEMAERMYRIIEKRFPGSAGATIERARWLYERGDPSAASALLTGEDEASAIARLRLESADLVVTAAFGIAAKFPDSGLVADAALEALASRTAWKEFRQLLARIERFGVATPRSWFWRALEKVLSGDSAGAVADIRQYGPETAGYAGILDIAMLELAVNNPGAAKEAASLAAALAVGNQDEATACVLIGDAERALGSMKEARSAYYAALSADPESRTARSRLERLGVP